MSCSNLSAGLFVFGFICAYLLIAGSYGVWVHTGRLFTPRASSSSKDDMCQNETHTQPKGHVHGGRVALTVLIVLIAVNAITLTLFTWGGRISMEVLLAKGLLVLVWGSLFVSVPVVLLLMALRILSKKE